MPTLATSDEFLDRVDDVFLEQLSEPAGGGGPNVARITAALEDASAEIEKWLARAPTEQRPTDEALRGDCVRVALYYLTLNRPVADIEQIYKAYKDVIRFYEGLVKTAEDAGSAAGDGSGRASRPCPAFDDDTLKGFV